MAPSPFHPKASRHARSISLPSRSHPLTLQVEEHLHSLRASEATSSSLASVNDLLHLPLTQQTLAQEQGEDWLDEDVLLQMKECVADLQSSLRRIRGESCLGNEIEAYTLSRKKVTRGINKCLGDLRKLKKQHTFSSLLDKNHDIVAMVSVLREVESITLSIFESQLSFVSGPRAMSRPNCWSFVSKLMNKKPVARNGIEMERCVFEKVDATLGPLLSHKTYTGLEFRHVETHKQLETLELSIQYIENGLECIFRSLIQTRVTLLSIFNQ
ncbi:hypothetical protein NE237_017154 [Protea cynaroides]|uniref:Uncharacterized protein n=1 Tax=Protea cynaroides TaxID=273540 RepID=A0A9Q0QMI4_9MAGN|nr:hypothetical protein NE237_017154 [Protea cynaroides]